MTDIPFTDLRDWYEAESGLLLAPGIEALRDEQALALEWALEREEPYLFINAPTGVGKTLINTTYGVLSQMSWTYAVHTIMLQNQVARSFENLPVFTGRANHPCLIGMETHMREVTAAEGICTDRQWCPHTGRPGPDGEARKEKCSYYAQRDAAVDSPYRVANYALWLTYPPLKMYDRMEGRPRTGILLADEAHNVEAAVCNSASFYLSRRTFRRFRATVPDRLDTLMQWKGWAERVELPGKSGNVPDLGLKAAADVLTRLKGFGPQDEGQWLVEYEENGVRFTPIWGAPFVLPQLFGHDAPPANADLFARARWRNDGVRQAIFTSATLMGAEYIAETLGLPDGSWAYLDIPSPFPTRNRPINYAPVMAMNYKNTATPEGRRPMQEAIDRLIEFYVLNDRPTGLIHAVSNKYRDNILTESRWRAIMVSTPSEHEENVRNGRPSVLVAANLTEGWDGVDDLCRFVLMPKVPFPSLGDKRTALRKEEDARSYDHRALVSIVQGAGRGVRHTEDYADTWILDRNWRILMAKRKDWLPEAFLSAYHHNVQLP